MECWFIFLFSAFWFHQTYGICPQDSPGNPMFGPYCTFSCHCKNNEQCDEKTGECPSGCAFPWVGAACQHKDIGRNGRRKMLKAFNSQLAGYAIDNSSDTCSESKHPYKNELYDAFNPYWKVYITNKTTIQGLIIQTKQDNIGDLIKGFNITVENITLDKVPERVYFPQESSLCYQHHPGDSLDVTFKVQCAHHVVGNQIRITLENTYTHLALCDVSVFGECPVNQCGPDCLTVCHCKEFSYQDKISGNCSSGCAGRWTGVGKKCDTECNEQQWGSRCERTCGYCRTGQPCYAATGECPNGCTGGYRGPTCFSQCDEGFHGNDCNQRCSINCKGGLVNCNHVNGHCEQNCTAGWQGIHCNTICTFGYYGDGCRTKCSRHCIDGNCSHVTGYCQKGCVAGWRGDSCTTECPDGMYGMNCTNTCGRCSHDKPCNKTNGICTNGCAPGYIAKDCIKECSNGRYGEGCQEKCSKNCRSGLAQCNHITGHCEQNCNEGWKGEKCDEECSEGYFGKKCKKKCSSNCIGGHTYCNHVDGHCEKGCIDGWRKKGCTQECADGKFGKACKKKCSSNCRGGKAHCNHVTGHCDQNCTKGWKGEKCDKECGDGRFGEACQNECSNNCQGGHAHCNHITGHCERNCTDGWKGERCDEVCSDGFYGEDCQQICSDNCQGGHAYCNHISGHCESNCTDGWEGKRCDESCPDGRYGENCQKICNDNCQGGYAHCNHTSGHCESNCKDGWKGELCDEDCSDGFYGENCQQVCSDNCQGGYAYCNHTSGYCESNCTDGWEGERCDEECPDGSYGPNCLQSCGNCAGGSACDKTDGTCIRGCTIGYYEPLCDKECKDGLYGLNCSMICGQCLDGKACGKSDGICSDGCAPSYQDPYCVQVLELREETPISVATGAALGGIVGGIIALLVSIALVADLLYRRRRQNCENPSQSQTAPLTDSNDISNTSRKPNVNKQSTSFNNIAVNVEGELHGAYSETSDADASNVYHNTMNAPMTAIYLHDLKDYTLAHSKTTKLVDEFESIPYGLRYPTNVAKKPVNVKKNRYKNMYPYDHSRVILNQLPGEPDSDYINASYINGYRKDKAYIAAQGPIDSNVADFWRMIWEKDVNTIVMLTNPIEKGKMKCIEYWKHEETGDVRVAVSSEETFAEMIIRTITMHKVSTAEERDVVQYHFTAWPDKATPDGACGLVHFLHKCRANYVNTDPPVVVHCSAGVGRTGTFMALDILYEQGKDLGHVDIFTTVENLRIQRLNTVQTKGQYVFLHEAVYEALVLPGPIFMQQFANEYYKIQNDIGKSREVKLLEQYKQTRDELLSKKIRNHFNDIPDDEDEFEIAKQVENRKKNRYKDILAANEFRPFLATDIDGCNNYINAVYMPSYRATHVFLITQAPLSHTTVDCCRLLYEQDIKLIVTFDNDALTQDEKYLPDRGTLRVGPFEINFLSKDDKTGYTIRRHQLSYKGHKAIIKQAVYTDWSKGQTIPMSHKYFLDLIQEIQNLQTASDDPILVQCLNGAEKSGLFVVMMNVLERMKVEGNVGIHQTIRQLRAHRQQIIPNYEQYKFCHDLALSHLEENNTYANV